MLTQWLMDGIGAIVGWVSGLLPEANSDGWWSGFGGLVNNLDDLNYYLPIGELAVFVVGFTSIFVLLGPIKLMLWLLSWVRGGAQA